MPVKITLFLSLLLSAVCLRAQVCTAPGQNPGTAFPVCGTNTFVQNNVPVCGVRDMLLPCNDGAGYQDKNPFWYKFTCFSAGTLVFTVTPINLNDDYDWQLFDITGRNPNDVYTNASLYVCSNWSAKSGATGTNLTATNLTACAGNTPNYSRAPALVVGHEYLLLVSHFTDSQSGYRLAFNGGTASITDTTAPRLQSVVPGCDGLTLSVKLNKKMKCNTLAANGSDFRITSGAVFTGGPIISASGAGCSTGFDTDSILLTLQTPLSGGIYQLVAQNGADGNTLLDNCNNQIPAGSSLGVVIAPNQPTPFDSLSPVGCAPQTLKVVFRKPIRCNSIAADGSDFTVTGTTPVSISTVSGACNAGAQTSTIFITLTQPLQTAGNFTLTLRRGTDANTLVDICGQETTPGSQISFSTKDTVAADFDYTVFLDCKLDSVAYVHDGRNGVNSWTWLFDNTRTSTLQNPVIRYPVFGEKTARLVVSNGTCTDTATAVVNLDNYLKANFGGPDILCPKDSARFTDSTRGKIKSWQWTFGNGNNSTLKQPPVQVYPTVNLQTTYSIQLVVEDSLGCRDSTTRRMLLVNNCYIDVPTAFTPNGDGLNDYLYPLNAYKAMQLQFKVYNRYGQLVWQTTDWTRKWDGRINGQLPETGTYVWFLSYIHRETRQKIQLQGTSVLIR